MKKDRLVIFTDGVIAIILTILVIDLDVPPEPTFAGLWEIRIALLTYLLTFFYITALWIKLFYEWYSVRAISLRVLVSTMIMLFFVSLLPYATRLSQNNFFSAAPQLFYGAVAVCVTLAVTGLNQALQQANPGIFLPGDVAHFKKRFVADLIIKGVGALLCVFVWPPFMSLGVFLTAFLLLFPVHKHPERDK